MKKFFISTIVAALVAALMGVFVACGDKDTGGKSDADIATEAISTISQVTNSSVPANKNTDSSYTVLGQVKVDGKSYNVIWTVSSDFPNNVSVGEKDSTGKVTINITKAQGQEISYTLKATVTVGKASKSAEFARKVSAGQAVEGQTEASLSFDDLTVRKNQTADQQVWEANGIKLVNDKYTSSSDVADYSNPVRIYAGSSIKIERDGMTTVVFRSSTASGDSSKYADLKTALEAAKEAGEIDGTIEEDATNLAYTVKLANPLCVLEFTVTKQIRLSSIDVVYNNAGVADADKVAEAKKVLDLAEKKYGLITEYDLPATKNGAAVTWTVEGESTNVSITNTGKLKVNSMPAEQADVTLKATIKSNSVEETKNITITLVNLGITADGTVDHPLKPSEAVKVAKLLNVKQTSAKTYYVKGFAIVVGDYQSSYSSFANTYIADVYAADKTSSAPDAIMIYGLKVDGEHIKDDNDKLNKGDEVTVKCLIQNYAANTQELVSPTCVARNTVQKTDAEIVAEAKAEKAKFLTQTTFTAVDTEGVTLPTTYGNFGATLIDWAVDTDTQLVEIAGGKLKIKALPEEGSATITLSFKVKSGDVQEADTITITVKKVTPLEAGTYKLAINQSGKTLYFKGTIASNFGVATENVLEAVDVVVAKTADGYTLKVATEDGDRYIEAVKTVDGTKTYYNFTLTATSNGYWQFNEDLDVLTWSIDGTEYFMGTYGTNARFGVSAKGYLDGTISSSYAQYPAGFETFDVTTLTAQEKVDLALSLVNDALSNVTEVNAEGIVLPTPNAALTDVVFAWEITEGAYEGVKVEDGKLKVTALPTDADATVTLTLTATCGEAELTDNTKEVTVTIKQLITNENYVVVTSEALNLPSAYAVEGTAAAGYNFAWHGMGDYGDGMQMRYGNKTTGTSSFWNTVAFDTKITSLTLVWSESKDIVANQTNQLVIEFANDINFTDAVQVYATFTTDKTITVEIPAGAFTFVRITHNNQGAVYLAEVKIGCEKAAEGGEDETETEPTSLEAILNDED